MGRILLADEGNIYYPQAKQDIHKALWCLLGTYVEVNAIHVSESFCSPVCPYPTPLNPKGSLIPKLEEPLILNSQWILNPYSFRYPVLLSMDCDSCSGLHPACWLLLFSSHVVPWISLLLWLPQSLSFMILLFLLYLDPFSEIQPHLASVDSLTVRSALFSCRLPFNMY